MAKKKRAQRFYDYSLLFTIVFLTVFGLIMIYSASSYKAQISNQYGGNAAYFMNRQAMIALAGFLIMLFISKLDYHWYSRFAVLAYIMSFVLMITVSLVGKKVNGKRRWLVIGGIQFQPTELVKITSVSYTHLQHSSYDSRTLPYRRGDITDRNGTYLATSEKVYNLIIDPGQIYENGGEVHYLAPTVDALVQCFGYDRAELLAAIEEKKDTRYLRYERRLSYEKKEEFETLKKTTNDAYKEAGMEERVYGVWFEDEYKRLYPYSCLLYTSKNHQAARFFSSKSNYTLNRNRITSPSFTT